MSNKPNIFDSVSPMKGGTDKKSDTKTDEKEVTPEKEIKVIAIFEGYIHPNRIPEGKEFMIAESKFSKRWMQKVEDVKTEEKE